MTQISNVGKGSGETHTNVVFLHGLGGHPRTTWQCGLDEQSFWPSWLAEDLPGVSVYSIGYEASVSRWRGRAMHLAYLATNVLARILAEPELQKPLVGRSDLPTDLATKMQEFVPEDLRQQLVDQHHAALARDSKSGGGTAASGHSPEWALSLALEMRAAGALTIEFLLKTLRDGKVGHFDELFARYSRISSAAAHQILNSPTGEALAVALKAQGVDKSTFATLLLLSRKARDPASMSSSTLTRATETFEKLKVEEAKKRLAALQAAYPEDPAPT